MQRPGPIVGLALGPIGKSEPVSIVKKEPFGAVGEVPSTRYVRGAQLGTRVNARSIIGDQDVA